MQTKTTLSFYFTSFRRVIIKNKDGSEPWRECDTLNTAGGNASSVEGSRGPADRTPMGPSSITTCHTRKTAGPTAETLIVMFTATLLAVSRTWSQPRHLTDGEWVIKSWCLCVTEFYSVERKNEIFFIREEKPSTDLAIGEICMPRYWSTAKIHSLI